MISGPCAGCHDPNSGVTALSGRTAYVSNFALGRVTAIRTATNTALPPIKTGRNAVTNGITP